jgi:hypothetical protein
MKRISVPFGLLIAAMAHGQVKMVVLVEGHRSGTATLSQRLTDKGGKVVNMTMTLESGEDEVSIESQQTYDSRGVPLRMFQQVVVTGKDHSRHEAIVTFDEDGANVVIDDDGDRSTKHIPILTTNSREDPSEFWFVRDQPIVGESVMSYHFNIDTLVWEPLTTTYKGMRPVTTDGRRELANVVTSEKGSAFLDVNGLPLRLDLPNSSLERLWDPEPGTVAAHEPNSKS